MGRSVVVVICLCAVVILSGCSLLTGEEVPEETLTPVELSDTDSKTQTKSETETEAVVTTHSSRPDRQPRYLSLQPTCERPPGAIVHIQVNALINNNPTGIDGVKTAWNFSSPTYRSVIGSPTEYKNILLSQYEPLFNARTVTYGPITIENGTAIERVTIKTSEGTVQSYRWRLNLQKNGRYDGCWMTRGIFRAKT